jgi:hypothetical protein
MKKYVYFLLLIGMALTHVQCDKASADSASYVATGTGGSTARFTITGNYLYTVDKENLKVFSIIDPTNPILKNTIPVGFEIETIYPFKDKLFIGSTSVIYIFSITNPEVPVKLSTAVSPNVLRRCDPVIARDSVAYATLRTNGFCGGTQSILSVYDVRDVLNPVQKSFLPVTEPYGLGFADTALYVCDKKGLNVYSISKPYSPYFIKNLNPNEWFYDVIPSGNTLICWVSNGLILFDITNKGNPQFITKII